MKRPQHFPSVCEALSPVYCFWAVALTGYTVEKARLNVGVTTQFVFVENNTSQLSWYETDHPAETVSMFGCPQK
jgi:hypothetical protein